MISFLKVVEELFSLLFSPLIVDGEVKHTPECLEWPVHERTPKPELKKFNSQSRITVNDFLQEARKPSGFPLNSDFGWTVTIFKPENKKESVSASEYVVHQKKEILPQKKMLMYLKISSLRKDSLTTNKEEQNRTWMTRKKKSRHVLTKFRYLSWKWTEVQLLHSLVICARNDPFASEVLALKLNETDDEERWREMEKPHLEFLQLAGNLNKKLMEMKEETREMRKELKFLDIEMKTEEVKAKTLQHEAQHLISEVLEIICADEMLISLGGTSLRKNLFPILKYKVKKRKKMKISIGFRKRMLFFFQRR